MSLCFQMPSLILTRVQSPYSMMFKKFLMFQGAQKWKTEMFVNSSALCVLHTELPWCPVVWFLRSNKNTILSLLFPSWKVSSSKKGRKENIKMSFSQPPKTRKHFCLLCSGSSGCTSYSQFWTRRNSSQIFKSLSNSSRNFLIFNTS